MQHKRRFGKKRWALFFLALLVAYGYWALNRPLPMLQPADASSQLQVQTSAASLAWPNVGQSAVGITGSSIVTTHGQQTPVATASTAKLITVLCVLQKKPLAPGQQGPMITLGVNDVTLYNSYVAREGSVVPVNMGEQISEYQALQAILLPSANNVADSLAIWAFGSLQAYAAYANNYVKQLGMTHTHIGSDASGFSPDTTSTAGDLVNLGKTAMKQPVIAGIVSQRTADIPVAGTIRNINDLLGVNGIVGIKTGNSDEAGGVFISAAQVNVNGKPLTIVTAVAGAPNLPSALQLTLPLVQTAEANFKPVTVLNGGAIVGHYDVPWGGTVNAIIEHDLDVVTWNGNVVPADVHQSPLPAGSQAGRISGVVTTSPSGKGGGPSAPLVLQNSVPPASAWWRLTHPFD